MPPTSTSNEVELEKDRNRMTAERIAEDRRPRTTKIIYVYKLGDYRFSGVRIPVSRRYHRSTENFLDELNSKIPGLPYGVRFLATAHGRNKITSLDQLDHLGSYVVGDRYRAHKSLKWDWEKFVASNKLDPKFRGIFRYANTTRSDLPLPQRHIYVPVTPIAANRSISLLLNHGEGLHDKIRIAHGTTAIIRRDRQKKDVELSLNERSVSKVVDNVSHKSSRRITTRGNSMGKTTVSMNAAPLPLQRRKLKSFQRNEATSGKIRTTEEILREMDEQRISSSTDTSDKHIDESARSSPQSIKRVIPEIRIRSATTDDTRSSASPNTQRYEDAARTIQAFYRRFKNSASTRKIRFSDVVMDVLQRELHKQLKLSAQDDKNDECKQHQGENERPETGDSSDTFWSESAQTRLILYSKPISAQSLRSSS